MNCSMLVVAASDKEERGGVLPLVNLSFPARRASSINRASRYLT